MPIDAKKIYDVVDLNNDNLVSKREMQKFRKNYLKYSPFIKDALKKPENKKELQDIFQKSFLNYFKSNIRIDSTSAFVLQFFANTYLGAKIRIDGIFGKNTNKVFNLIKHLGLSKGRSKPLDEVQKKWKKEFEIYNIPDCIKAPDENNKSDENNKPLDENISSWEDIVGKITETYKPKLDIEKNGTNIEKDGTVMALKVIQEYESGGKMAAVNPKDRNGSAALGPVQYNGPAAKKMLNFLEENGANANIIGKLKNNLYNRKSSDTKLFEYIMKNKNNQKVMKKYIDSDIIERIDFQKEKFGFKFKDGKAFAMYLFLTNKYGGTGAGNMLKTLEKKEFSLEEVYKGWIVGWYKRYKKLNPKKLKDKTLFELLEKFPVKRYNKGPMWAYDRIKNI